MTEEKLKYKIKVLIIAFIICLVVSGITAFPIETELQFLNKHLSIFPGPVRNWLQDIFFAVKTTNSNFPFLSYGTDWLAFAHIVIAISFIGPLRDPIKNIWVIEFGIISCLLVIPLAFIAGPIRGIPFYWQIIDCSFGVIGLIPLTRCRKLIIQLEKINN